jgi:kynurenine formamidase
VTGRNWGRYGPDDERGALNLVTPDGLRRAAALVKTGKAYSLAMPISRSGTPPVYGRSAPERLTRTAPDDVLDTGSAGSAEVARAPGAEAGERVGANEDVLIVSSHAGTHLDGLSHVFVGEHFYNGHPVSSFTTRKGAGRLAITTTATIATRGVLLDVVAARPDLAPDGMLPAGYTVTAGDLAASCDRQNVRLEPGDAALVRTGWAERFQEDRNTPTFPQPGLGLEAATWLVDRDVAVVGVDNSAVEVLPFEGGGILPVHVELIVNNGVSLVEHLYLAELAADGCHEFLLVIGALPVVGATGSPVNPVAIA